MTSRHCTFAIHSSVWVKSTIYFEYKGTQFKLVPSQKPFETDCLVCRMDALSSIEAYKKACEFFSAFCYAKGAKVSVGAPFINEVPMNISLSEMHWYSTEPRDIAPQESCECIFDEIALIRTEHQSTLVRLYRQAFSINDPYVRFLFYWHALVYPNPTDSEAVKYINENYLSIKDSYIDLCLNFINKDPMFLKTESKVIADLGQYFKDGIRHSIAHIERDRTSYKSLELDNIEEIKHVNAAGSILEQLVRRRLETEYGLEVGYDSDIYNPSRVVE